MRCVAMGESVQNVSCWLHAIINESQDFSHYCTSHQETTNSSYLCSSTGVPTLCVFPEICSGEPKPHVSQTFCVDNAVAMSEARQAKGPSQMYFQHLQGDAFSKGGRKEISCGNGFVG
jgi:hypothetical protein